MDVTCQSGALTAVWAAALYVGVKLPYTQYGLLAPFDVPDLAARALAECPDEDRLVPLASMSASDLGDEVVECLRHTIRSIWGEAATELSGRPLPLSLYWLRCLGQGLDDPAQVVRLIRSYGLGEMRLREIREGGSPKRMPASSARRVMRAWKTLDAMEREADHMDVPLSSQSAMEGASSVLKALREGGVAVATGWDIEYLRPIAE